MYNSFYGQATIYITIIEAGIDTRLNNIFKIRG